MLGVNFLLTFFGLAGIQDLIDTEELLSDFLNGSTTMVYVVDVFKVGLEELDSLFKIRVTNVVVDRNITDLARFINELHPS